MSRRAGSCVLVGLGVAAVLAAALARPIPQDPAYHQMADQRTWLGVPHALNVLSNLAFLLAGALGLCVVLGPPTRSGQAGFVDPRERWPYLAFFGGLLLTGLGSGFYHLAPGNERLVWDRLPLAVTLMGLLAATIAERIDLRAGLWLLPALAAVGIGSVAYWYATELRQAGDLRPYALVQFYPLVAIPLMLGLFSPRYTRGGDLLGAAAIYALGKLFEVLDEPIFAVGRIVSGHTLKHLAAALSGYWVLRMLMTRRPALIQGRP